VTTQARFDDAFLFNTNGYTYTYDRFGNRWHQNLVSGSGNQVDLGFDTSNRISAGYGIAYDAAGNMTNDGTHTYTYDAEGRVTAVDGGTTASYKYDAMGRRASRTVGTSTWDDIYDQSGRMITEIQWQPSPTIWRRSEFYVGGAHVATYADATTYFTHYDWLGTARARTNVSGSVIETCTSWPFGDGQTCTPSDYDPLHFATSERDVEDNQDHFWFRQYFSAKGVWTSPDPAGMMVADPGNPQSWNRYQYVRNDPVSYFDPFGLTPKPVAPPDPNIWVNSGWTSLNLMWIASQPTFGIVEADPEFPFSDNSTLYLYFGNWELASLLMMGFPHAFEIGHHIGPNASRRILESRRPKHSMWDLPPISPQVFLGALSIAVAGSARVPCQARYARITLVLPVLLCLTSGTLIGKLEEASM
jgi:RHS repeat-associated protein